MPIPACLSLPVSSHDGGIIVHVAASQLTSSKLCTTSKPMAEKPSKLPSPSIYNMLARADITEAHPTYIVKKARIAPLGLDLPHA